MEALDIVASIANQETIKKSVKQGMGITVLSRLAAEDEDGLLIFPIPGAVKDEISIWSIIKIIR